ncbi:hypothetical protein KJA17_01630 [Patescibacteria group bacterium]|nr:hypothetical protein [Patescibacteria group bacterium]
MTGPKKRLIIIDSNSLIHRAYHALPPLTTKKGELVNAIYGFLLVFLKALRELKPDFVAATFDLPGPTFRHKEFKEYKAKRPPAPQELYQQISKVKEVLRAFNVPVFEKQGFEADDVIGAIATSAPKKQIFPELETIILSGDLDTLQLVSPKTRVLAMRKGIKDTVLYDVEKVKERYQGLSPGQLPDFKGLKGDPSDNIPGVPGIGEKTAIQLIKEFGSLENLYKEIEKNTEKSKKIKENIRQKLKESKEQALFSKVLTQIQCNVPLDFQLSETQFKEIDKEKITKVFKDLEFYTLIKRLEEISPGPILERQKAISFTEEGGRIEEDIEKLYQEGVFSKRIRELEKALVPVVRKMEKNGIKIDIKALKGLSRNLEKKIKKLESRVFKITRTPFNINSPKLLSEVLFKKLKIPTGGIKKTPGGVFSTEAGELEKLRSSHPVINLILKYRGLFKLKSGFVDALPKMATSEDGRIHPNFHQLGTETGRMSCSDPNLQNIPIKGEIGKEIRKCFIPEKGFLFLSADYSQIELAIAASIATDKKMIEYFKRGEDIHKLTASEIFGVAKEKVSGEMRELAKTLNYAIFYGMGKRSFSQRAGISPKTAEEFIKKYFDSFRELSKYVSDSVEKAKEKGFAETLFGRKRFLPEINSIDPRLKAQAERIAVNMGIQGSAADIVKMAMIEIEEQGVLNDDCKMILQIHDELLFEIRKSKIKEVAPKIKEIMENIVKFEVPLKVDMKVGDNWAEMRVITE